MSGASKTKNLRIPGPTPVPPEVLQALARPVISHRGPDLDGLMQRLRPKLREVFQTQHEVLIFAASGTGGMEAAVVNLLSPGDRVLVSSVGVFGERWAQIAQAFGAAVERLQFPHGEAIDPDGLAAHLAARGPYRALFLTHNETSTGVTNDLGAISQTLDQQGGRRPLLVVDAISSLAAIDLRTDAWGCDVVITGSQKALMTPPGLALVSVSTRALAASEEARNPRFYWDFRKALQAVTERNEFPFTPSVSLLQGLDVALDRILEEGLPNCFARHQELADFFRQGVAELGLEFLAREPVRSNTVTAVKVPPGLPARVLIGRLREEFGIEVAGGQGPLKGQIFRVGHMGWVSREDLAAVLDALREILFG
ncbi:MAG: pyridoxal-phosphate-dependent aminotransferase family protein [Anaerolineae bacterium]